MLVTLSRLLDEAECKLSSISLKSVRERVAEALVLIHNSINTENDCNSYPILLSREDLASFVGSATESVIRVLSEFKDEKTIEIKGRSITILEMNALRKIANLKE